MMNNPPFTATGPTVPLNAGTTSATVSISGFVNTGNATGGYPGTSVMVTNAGSVVAFFDLNGQTATSASIPIAANSQRAFACAPTTSIAAVTLTSTSQLYFTPGFGGN